MPTPVSSDRALAAGLVQPDQTTCGSSVLVVARMLHDEAYAGFLLNGAPGAVGGSTGSVKDRFAEAALAMHRTTSKAKDSGGGWQVPWPKALGTQPWALAAEMTRQAGQPGLTYVVRPILPNQRASTFAAIRRLAVAGHAVPLYVGNTWSPRHVVLVLPERDDDRVDTDDDEVRIYDPASGRRYDIEDDDFARARLDVAGWKVPWVVIAPTAR